MKVNPLSVTCPVCAAGRNRPCVDEVSLRPRARPHAERVVQAMAVARAKLDRFYGTVSVRVPTARSGQDAREPPSGPG